ncbi:hypothetical protein SELMODRAFT_431345 [Selaginella moellendorffii]|uniref:Poly(A) RNA polymerase mitochondrial-like central palm domain-containing protein n=2 Tax=Selaginella moellendorffii TaxID=88036 RepID=D8TCA7_SELML|nr:hypothetical protein SELMODRAFT_431345 [Selaginella moellendorffii]
MLGSSGGHWPGNGFFSSGEIRKKAQDVEELVNASFSWTAQKEIRFSRAIEEILGDLEPSQEDRDARAAIVASFDSFVKQTLSGSSVVAPFGSYVTNTFTCDSDLDLSLYVNRMNPLSREEKLYFLKRVTTSLQAMHARYDQIQPIYKATVPVVKFVDRKTGIQCDLSVDNKDGASKSLVLAALSSIDKRFRPLCLLLKKWAKSHEINDASAGTLSSYVITLLAIFHLQTCSPPVLPPLSMIIGGLDLRDASYCSGFISARAKAFQGFGARNMDRISELFRTFFVKITAVKALWQEGLCASTYHAQWISKWPSFHNGCICVEDFYDPSRNAAKAVTPKDFEYIYQCLENSVDAFRRPITDMESFKKMIVGDGCMPKVTPPPRPEPRFPDPRDIRPSLAVPLLLQGRPHRPALGPPNRRFCE